MNSRDPHMEQSKKNSSLEKIQRPSFFRIIFLALLIWLVINYFFNTYAERDQINLSYSRFKELVTSGKIKEVTFKGDDINGSFKDKYLVTENAGKDSTYYDSFKTTKPPVEDAHLLSLLEDKQVTVKAVVDDSSWWQIILISFLPLAIIIGLFMYAGSKMRGNLQQRMGGGLFGVGRSKAKRYEKTKESITFHDVAGLENAKTELQEIVLYLKHPQRFRVLGAQIPKGILLMGAPGTGKTLLARATAGEANVSFFNISGSEFIEMFVGVGASRVRDMFENAKRESPSIIFIDEIDSVGRARGTGLGGGNDEREQTLNQILSEMDGFQPHLSVIVIAATNRPDVLDSALTRPGRFDRQITLDMPHKEAREEILKIHTRRVPLNDDVDLQNLASRTVGFSGADIKNLVNEAALLAGRRNGTKVSAEDFDNARDRILLGAEREDKIDEEEKKVIAIHEAGHALVSKLTPNGDPLQKVTIIPRGRSLGVTEQLPVNERHNLTRAYLLDRMVIMLGGRAAEKVVFNEITSGSSSDLKQLTMLARRMVCQWGMSENLGPVYFEQGEEHPFLGREITEPKKFSESTAQLIDQEIQNLIHKMESKAIHLISDNRKKLDLIADALIAHETLDSDMVDKILAGK